MIKCMRFMLFSSLDCYYKWGELYVHKGELHGTVKNIPAVGASLYQRVNV